MSRENAVSSHYGHGDLLNTIQASLHLLGKSPDTITIEDLAAVDEFHIGGRPATESLLSQLNVTAKDHLLDVGCGLGGAARFVACTYHSRVTGIDLVDEYVETGKVLCQWLKLEQQVSMQQGSALAMPFAAESFDGGYMLHVGMNIEDKQKLFAEIHRVLRPGACFGIYDVMRMSDGELTYPVPWATQASESLLSTPAQYKQAAAAAGFTLCSEHNRREFALAFVKMLREKMAASGGPPPLGLHLLMKESAPVKIKNMIDNIAADYVAPVELIVQKP